LRPTSVAPANSKPMRASIAEKADEMVEFQGGRSQLPVT
jgi:hypothetical protein